MVRAKRERETVLPEIEREESGLIAGQHQLIRAGRHAMAKVIWSGRSKPQERIALLAVAYTGGFADFVSASAAAPELIAVVNQQLAGVGLKLTPVERN